MESSLLNNKELEWSAVVANNAMNRERVAIGINSYEKDIKLNPIQHIEEKGSQSEIRWLDLCCGRGNALIQVYKHFEASHIADRLFLEGIDLVDYFADHPLSEKLSLRKLNLSDWQPTIKYDLITSVHGIHYLGDKLEVITKSMNALKDDGLFVANLDLDNIKIEGQKNSKPLLSEYFKENNMAYNSRTKILKAAFSSDITSRFIYQGADDKAGPNYTGQAAVNSVYSLND